MFVEAKYGRAIVAAGDGAVENNGVSLVVSADGDDVEGMIFHLGTR